MAKKKTNSNVLEIAASQFEGIKLLFDHIDELATERLVQMVLQAGRIFVTGQGRSGLIANCFATRLAQMGLNVHIPGLATCQRIDKPDLMITVSCSGTTVTTVELVKTSRNAGAEVAVITALDRSPLAQLATHIVLIPSDNEDIKARCTYVVGPNNNTLFEETTLLYFDTLVYILLQRKGISENIISQRHTNLE
jgi:6-phospho-3-hexuloisomerase